MPNVNPISVSYSELLTRAKNITLPDFQRTLVWTDLQKKELLFSTLLGFPIGAICVAKDKIEGSSSSYLLDGQQRLDCIRDLVDPYIASSWLNIPKPKWPHDPDLDDKKEYYENMLWSDIYQFLGIDFYKSDEYENFISTNEYMKLEKKLKEHNSKQEVALANAVKKKRDYKEYTHRQKWLLEQSEGDGTNEPKDGYLRAKNHLVSQFFSIYYHHPGASKTLEELILGRARFQQEDFNLQATIKTHSEVLEDLLNQLEEVAHNETTNDVEKVDTSLKLIFETTLEKKDLVPREQFFKDGVELSDTDKEKLIAKWFKLYKNHLFGTPDKIANHIQYFKDRRLYKENIIQHKLSILEFNSEDGRRLTEIELAKVFELVNMSGLPLTHIEILACRPGWREKLSLDVQSNNVHKKLFEEYEKISRNMGLHKKNQTSLTQEIFNKWHIASGLGAVLINRQTKDEATWILKVPPLPKTPEEAPSKLKDKQKFNTSRKNEIQNLSKFGFHLLSLLSTNKIDTPTWSQLSGNGEVKWTEVIQMVDHLRSAGEILKADSFFKNILQWKDTIEDFFANNQMATRAFLKIMYDEYIAIVSENKKDSAKKKEYIFKMRRLFDNTLYSVVTGYWSGGSAEQKITDFITEYNATKIENAVTTDEWEKLLTEMCDSGTIHSRDYHKDQTKVSKDNNLNLGEPHKYIRSILQYKLVLSDIQMNASIPVSSQDDYTKHLDHIIPKQSWKTYLEPHKSSPYQDLPNNNFTHHICNLTILGYDANCAKQETSIDIWWTKMKAETDYVDVIKEQLTNWADLPDNIKELEKMNEPSKFEKLRMLRKTKFIETFKKNNRDKYLFLQP